MDVAYANTQAMPEVEVVIFPATKSPKELRKKKGKLFFYCSTGHAGKQEKGGGKRGKFSRQNEKRW